MKKIFLFLIFLVFLQGVYAHSALDFVPVEEEEHLHISEILVWINIILIGFLLVIQIISQKKKDKKYNTVKYGLIALILAIMVWQMFIEEPPTSEIIEGFQANGKIVELNMSSYNFGYEPNTFTVSAGDTVRLNINNLDFTHTFSIYELGVNEILYPKSIKTIEFTAFKKGDFPIFCGIEGHRISGMEGIFVVE
jgi:heme/copper-type cytochrome/quinol oxidase subunit 2